MDIQNAFDIMVARLTDGRGRATGDYGCEYLNHDGTPCVVGAVLPEGHPARNPDYCGYVDEVAKRFESETPRVISDNLAVMGEMQHLHDEPKNWKGRYLNTSGLLLLRKVADRFSLALDPSIA